MKYLLGLLFIAGFLIGRWNPSDSGQDRQSAREAKRATASGSPVASGNRQPGRIHVANDKVQVAPEQLSALLDFETSPALCMRAFLGNPFPEAVKSLDNLAKWMGLEQAEKSTLEKIIREAATDRMRWEKENVKLQSAVQGKWTLDFPGDKGAARDQLRSRLSDAFGPEKATAIELAGNLDRFFWLDPESAEMAHGRVEIQAKIAENSKEWMDGLKIQVTWDRGNFSRTEYRNATSHLADRRLGSLLSVEQILSGVEGAER